MWYLKYRQFHYEKNRQPLPNISEEAVCYTNPTCTLHPRPLVRPSEAGGFGLVDGGGVEFAVGGVYDGFVVVYVEREMVDFFSERSVDVALVIGWIPLVE